MTREKRPPFDRPAPTDEELLVALKGKSQTSSATVPSASKATSSTKIYSTSRPALEPSDWVPKECQHCGRDWRTLVDSYATDEQKRQINGQTQHNINRAIFGIIVDHPCPEGDEYTRKRRERADKIAAKRIAKEEAAEKALQIQEDQDKVEGKRRSRRRKKQDKKVPEGDSEDED